MNEITLRATFGATAAPGVTPVGQYTEPVRVAGPTLLVQAIGAGANVTLQGSNLPGVVGSWVDVATVAAGVPEQVECLYGWVRVGASAPCEVGVSGAHGAAAFGGGAGGGSSDTTEATQVLVKDAAQSIDGKTPALVVKQVIDEASATVTYIGEAALGTATSAAAWRIKRITVAGAITTIAWSAPGVIFDNRASLGYT